MIIEGPNIKHQSQLIYAADKTTSNLICQLMVFNSVKNTRNMNYSAHANQKHMYEMPVPLYITMKIHTVTRSRNLIDTLFSLGICVYDRFLRLTSDISNALCEQFNNDGVVCSPKLRSSLFTAAAVDNIRRLQPFFCYCKGFISWDRNFNYSVSTTCISRASP